MVITAKLAIGPPQLMGFGFATLALAGITLANLWEKRFGLPHHPVTTNLVGYSAGLLGLLPFLCWNEHHGSELDTSLLLGFCIFSYW